MMFLLFGVHFSRMFLCWLDGCAFRQCCRKANAGAPGSGAFHVVQLREQIERQAAALATGVAAKRTKWDSTK
ncbi:hypothetical protein DUNSADRAFT_18403 [Dunaliella salina]|uniref:Secreted protein n=1 Tax=Dunaliella salina TaxID=3046 RepID=A0ABQ7GZ23_DUNSA|nr:hypothetical protein DUNSADRAFT_18403 [Dunaliella salina]|eukprot:KAF5839860.1 hypothetical protein DUNSADRAFT_18403 [Dunaliella salina]